MTKKAGRPPLEKAKQRSPGISIRFTEDERRPINEAIKASGLGTTVWARKALQYVAVNGIRIT